MIYRPLGRTGTQVSSLCLGCMTFGAKTNAEDSYAIIDRAIDAGINFLDTANVYSRGKSEEVTGEALKRNGKRDRIILATKVHGKMNDDDPNSQGNTRRNIIAACEASLRRLQTDYIDLYQLHRPHPSVPIDETLRALDDLIRAGKVRSIGTSTFAAWQVVESLWASQQHGLNRFVCEQPPYNLLDRRIERELVPMAQTYGIALIPWSPLSGGLLTGKYQRETKPEEGRYANPGDVQKRRYNDRAFDVIDALLPIAEAKNCPLSQLATAWCMAQPGITSPIIGPRTMEQLEDYLASLDVNLDAEDLRKIDEAAPPASMVAPHYEADFGPHPHRI